MQNRNSYYLKHSRLFLSFFLLLSFITTSFAQTAAPAKSALSSAEKEFAEKINVKTIQEITKTLADPVMEGRGTMQPGGDKAAEYIAAQMKTIGLKPRGDNGTYLQKIKFRETIVSPETTVKIGDETLKSGTDYYVHPMTAGNKTGAGEMVFVGYGIVSDAAKHNDLAGVDIAGKVVVMMTGIPKELEGTEFQKTFNPFVNLQFLAKNKAAGAIFIRHGREQGGDFEIYSQYLSRRRVAMTDKLSTPNAAPPIAAVNNSVAEKLFAASGTTLKDAKELAETTNFKPVTLNKTASFDLKYKETIGTGSNVAGVIEGSDPKLKEEAIVFSAHYDAYGVEGGKIYPGAADNALGVAEMMAVAEAFGKSSPKPKRSLVFLAVTGEEYGLYGSKHWAANPTWDIKKVAANLNLDGIGTEVYGPVKTIVGYGAEHSSLGTVMSDIATAMDINVIPDPVPQEQVFYRSDHYAFVERGVPALMLLGAPAGDQKMWLKRVSDWEKVHYHQPGDTVQPDWHWDGARTVAVIMAVMAHRIASADTIPAWLPSSRFGKMERGHTGPVPKGN